jgi:hypothetical protein
MLIKIRWPIAGRWAKMCRVDNGTIIYGADDESAAMLVVKGEEVRLYTIDETGFTADAYQSQTRVKPVIRLSGEKDELKELYLLEFMSLLQRTDSEYAVKALTIYYRNLGYGDSLAEYHARQLVDRMEFEGEPEEVEMPAGTYTLKREGNRWLLEGGRVKIEL